MSSLGFKESNYQPKLFSFESDKATVQNTAETNTLKLKKAWDMSISSCKGIPMTAFMLWMAGDSIQIFSILILAMNFFNSIKAIISHKTGLPCN